MKSSKKPSIKKYQVGGSTTPIYKKEMDSLMNNYLKYFKGVPSDKAKKQMAIEAATKKQGKKSSMRYGGTKKRK